MFNKKKISGWKNVLDSYKFINSYNLPTLGSQLEVAGNIYLYDIIHIGYRDFHHAYLSLSKFINLVKVILDNKPQRNESFI